MTTTSQKHLRMYSAPRECMTFFNKFLIHVDLKWLSEPATLLIRFVQNLAVNLLIAWLLLPCQHARPWPNTTLSLLANVEIWTTNCINTSKYYISIKTYRKPTACSCVCVLIPNLSCPLSASLLQTALDLHCHLTPCYSCLALYGGEVSLFLLLSLPCASFFGRNALLQPTKLFLGPSHSYHSHEEAYGLLHRQSAYSSGLTSSFYTFSHCVHITFLHFFVLVLSLLDNG